MSFLCSHRNATALESPCFSSVTRYSSTVWVGRVRLKRCFLTARKKAYGEPRITLFSSMAWRVSQANFDKLSPNRQEFSYRSSEAMCASYPLFPVCRGLQKYDEFLEVPSRNRKFREQQKCVRIDAAGNDTRKFTC